MELALGLAALALSLVAPAVGREPRRNSLAITLVRELADPHWTGPEPEPEARPSLTLSTLTLCPPGRAHCSTCVRAQVALPCRVLPRNIVLDFLELSSNRHWEVRVRGRRRATAETWKWQEQRRAWRILEPPDPQLNSSHTPRTWQLSYECFEAEGGRDVLVSVSSSVFQEPVSVAYTVEDSERGPVFNVTLDGPARALVVSVLPGPVLKARLCYQHFIVCDDLSPPVTGLVDPSEALTARLSFPLLLPCLCVEVYHLGYDHWRRIACPLKDQRWDTRADDLWRSSTIHFLSQRSGSTLTLRWDSPCPLPHSSASLCWRDSETAPSACRVIVNSTLKREDSVYTISGVDRHPQLCVQLSYQDSYHVECPFGPGDADWTAEVTPAGSLQHLRITSGVPASFSAGLCRREEERCVPVAPVHRASLDSGSNATELRVTLSSPGPWLCVQVWRTDVAFSPKMLLCPYSESQREARPHGSGRSHPVLLHDAAAVPGIPGHPEETVRPCLAAQARAAGEFLGLGAPGVRGVCSGLPPAEGAVLRGAALPLGPGGAGAAGTRALAVRAERGREEGRRQGADSLEPRGQGSVPALERRSSWWRGREEQQETGGRDRGGGEEEERERSCRRRRKGEERERSGKSKQERRRRTGKEEEGAGNEEAEGGGRESGGRVEALCGRRGRGGEREQAGALLLHQPSAPGRPGLSAERAGRRWGRGWGVCPGVFHGALPQSGHPPETQRAPPLPAAPRFRETGGGAAGGQRGLPALLGPAPDQDPGTQTGVPAGGVAVVSLATGGGAQAGQRSPRPQEGEEEELKPVNRRTSSGSHGDRRRGLDWQWGGASSTRGRGQRDSVVAVVWAPLPDCFCTGPLQQDPTTTAD